jgi:hypothetical protein
LSEQNQKATLRFHRRSPLILLARHMATPISPQVQLDRTDPKTANFEVQSLCPTGERMLGGSMRRLEWRGQKAGHRADVHDPTSGLAAHRGSTACVIRTNPNRLVSKTALTCARLSSSMAPVMVIAALFTKTSIRLA